MKSLLRRLKRSLTTRILLVFLVITIVLEILLVVSLIHGFSRQWRVNIHPHLEQYLYYVLDDIGDPPSVEKAKDIADRLVLNIHITGPDTNYSSNDQPFDATNLNFHNPKQRRLLSKSDNLWSTIEVGEHFDRTVLRHTAGEYQVYFELPHRRHGGLPLVPLICMILLLALCYLILRRMLKPVQDIKVGVKRMGSGDLNYRVPVRADNDLGELATSINTMAGDIEQMLDAKRQLLLGASHELRSPLTRAKVALQLLDESPNRNRIEEDLAEMEMLITDILESERMKSGHAALERSGVDMAELVATVVNELQAVDLDVEIANDLPELSLDSTRIHILLRNILSNALTHGSNTDRHPTLSIYQLPEKEQLVIDVSDHGPGIPSEHLDAVSEPFYRIDGSRTRNTGGFGLGLHLAKLIAEAHGGHFVVESRTADETTASGTTILVTLPF